MLCNDWYLSSYVIDLIVCRSPTALAESTKSKLSIFCQVELKHVLSVHDVSNIYHVPLILVQQDIHQIIKTQLNLTEMSDLPLLSKWEQIAQTVDNFAEKVEIAIVGKYNGLQDSYLSVLKSLMHSGIFLNIEVDVKWIDATDLEEETKANNVEKYNAAWSVLKQVAGVVVPGGFGNRGVEGKIAAAKMCRESGKPYLGVCLGMQVSTIGTTHSTQYTQYLLVELYCNFVTHLIIYHVQVMVIEYARNVMGLTDANSAEFNEKTTNPVVVFMPEINPNILGGTMRLGSRATILSQSLSNGSQTLASKVYGFDHKNTDVISVDERHRHRYEVNPALVESMESNGLFFSGRDDTNTRMEIAELSQSSHPYYIGTQFHPEFKSRPNRPSPPFYGMSYIDELPNKCIVMHCIVLIVTH